MYLAKLLMGVWAVAVEETFFSAFHSINEFWDLYSK